MDSQQPKPKRLRFLLVATYAWLVVAYVGVLTIFGVRSKMTPSEFKDFAIENRAMLATWGAGITLAGIALSFLVWELRNLLRRKAF